MRDLIAILKLCRSQTLWMLCGVVLGLLTAIAGLGLLSFSGWFISAAAFAGISLTAASFNYYLPATGVRFFALMRIISRYGDKLISHDTTFKLIAMLRVWFFNGVSRLSPAQLFNHRKADLLNRVIKDVDALENAYLNTLHPIFIALLSSLLIFIFLMFFNHEIAWVSLGFMCFTLVGLFSLSYQLSKKSSAILPSLEGEVREHFIGLSSSLTELLIFNALSKFQCLLDACNQQWYQAQARLSQIKGLCEALYIVLSGSCLVVVLIIAIPLLNHQQLNGANLALIAFTLLAGFEVIQILPQSAQKIINASRSATRLRSITDQPGEIIFPEKSIRIIQQFDIAMKHITFAYPNSGLVLSDFDLEVSQGEHVAMIGPSGAGKSTIIQCLARFYEPQQGTISIGGVNIKEISEADLRSTIAIATQQVHIFNGTIRENLLIAYPLASDDELWRVLDICQLRHTVEQCHDGLDTWLGEHGERFSGGQIRRLSIARALLGNAPITILDEPTEGLDSTTAKQMLQAVKSHLQHRTMIIITHKLQDCQHVERVQRI